MQAYRRFWQKAPPVDLLAAGFMGYKGRDDKREDSEDSHEQFAQSLGLRIPDGV